MHFNQRLCMSCPLELYVDTKETADLPTTSTPHDCRLCKTVAVGAWGENDLAMSVRASDSVRVLNDGDAVLSPGEVRPHSRVRPNSREGM